MGDREYDCDFCLLIPMVIGVGMPPDPPRQYNKTKGDEETQKIEGRGRGGTNKEGTNKIISCSISLSLLQKNKAQERGYYF